MATDLTGLSHILDMTENLAVEKADPMGTPSLTLCNPSLQTEVTFGDGVGQCNQAHYAEYTFTYGETKTLALRGVLLNPLGGIANFAGLKYVFIYNTSHTQGTAGDTTAAISIAMTHGDFTGWMGSTAGTEGVGAGGTVRRYDPAGWAVGANGTITLVNKSTNSTMGAAVCQLVLEGTNT